MAQGNPPRILTLGETMLMLAPPDHELLEHSDSFRVLIGGSEANVAVGLERLGIHAGWVGKLPCTALGRRVENGIRRYGVDTQGIVWSETGRVGTFYVETGAKPRPTQTIYDRADSAFSTLTADELNWGYIGRAEWLHVTGITPALSDRCRDAAPEILRRARARDVKVSFDLNYRSKLWGPEEARTAWLEMLPHVNVLIATEADAAMLLGGEPAPDIPPERVHGWRAELVQRLQAAHGVDAVAITCSGSGSVGFDGQQVIAQPVVIPELVNRLGAGDAFAAGLLYGLIRANLATGLAYGNAMASLKFTIPQNLPLVDREDVEALVRGQAGPRLLR